MARLFRAARAARFAVAALILAGCGARYVVRPPLPRFDAIIVPGCPSEEDGSLSLCQMSRAAWAAILWSRGVARAFIVSGAAVHSPYVEAQALAAGMAALGVPPDRIWLEPNALHTDENMYFSLQIAHALGFHTLAVASQAGHAAWGCRMLDDWGQSCGAIGVDLRAVEAIGARERLARVRTPRVARWETMQQREHERLLRTGRRRPPSYLLYPYIGFLRLNGQRWIPVAPAHPPLETWAAWLASAAHTASAAR